MKSVFYNDNEPYVCEWLRNLIAAGHLPSGEVDGRDVNEVNADDLEGHEQCHFFAGIGGWPYALKLAGWEGPVWTASIPCQPFSSAGQQRGKEDERHLWPAFRKLVATCRPSVIFGEQVASNLGRNWLARVRLDLENIGYWQAYHEDLHEMLAAETSGELSEILGAVAGRIEINLQTMSTQLRSGVAQNQQSEVGGAPSGAEGKRGYVPVGIRRQASGRNAGQASGSPCQAEENTVRSGSTHPSNREANPAWALRNDWRSVQFSLALPNMEQPVSTSDRSSQGIYLPQHASGVLWDERGPGELGGRGATTDAQRLVAKECVNDERRIAEAFGAIVEASVERCRLAGVRADLENLGYAVGAADLCAAGVGSPHIRQRLWWVADANGKLRERRPGQGWSGIREAEESQGTNADTGGRRSLADGGLADSIGAGLEGMQEQPAWQERPPAERGGVSGGLGNANRNRAKRAGRAECVADAASKTSFWSAFDLIPCADGKARRIGTGIQPLAHGIPARVGKLRAAGNAIVPQVAAEFVRAFMETSEI